MSAKDKLEAAIEAVKHELVVIEDFPGYIKGEVIQEAEKIEALLKSEWQNHIVKRFVK